jgi:ADP-ribose pyrophosphatase YjhB (NUDIX family)
MTNWRIKLEPVITPVFRSWWRLSRPLTIGTRVLVTDAAGRVLLVRHSYIKGWHMPGGGVEQGEAVAAAAMRELAEEGGVEAQGQPEVFGIYVNTAFKNDHIVLFRVSAWQPCPPRAGPEILERGFFPRDALPEGVTKATLRRLAEVFDGAPRSFNW